MYYHVGFLKSYLSLTLPQKCCIVELYSINISLKIIKSGNYQFNQRFSELVWK